MISPPSSTSTDTVPGRHCAVEFQALPSRIGQVRRIVSAQLRYWRLDPLIDPVALGVTELLADVHRHAHSVGGDSGDSGDSGDKHCTVEIAFVRDRLTVSVHDHDPRLPSVRSSPEERMATSGRGLALVAAVSESWGMRARQDGSGKTVWFTLPGAPSPSRRRPTLAVPGVSASGTVSEKGRETTAAAPKERQPRTSSPV